MNPEAAIIIPQRPSFFKLSIARGICETAIISVGYSLVI